MAGGGSSRTDDGKKKARIEIIPLIDVIFFLLATFVLFTLSLNRIMSVPVNLPIAQPPTTPTPPDEDAVTIQVSDQGTCYWNQGAAGRSGLINLGEIAGRIAHYKTQVGEPRILITGDTHAKFGITVQILD